MKLVFILIFGLLAAVSGTYFCDPTICPENQKHIGCSNNGAFSENCKTQFYGVTDLKMVAITSSLRNEILDSHNSKRNALAGGEYGQFSTAERMPTIKWDDELAFLAAYNVKKCGDLYFKDCHNTDAFRNSGQNRGQISLAAKYPFDEHIMVLGLLNSWWSGYWRTSVSDLEAYPANADTIGQFMLMASERNVAVGCAAVRMKYLSDEFEEENTMTLVCNYATNNVVGKPTYTPGLKTSKCTTGTNLEYPALCSASEAVDPNLFN